MHTAISQRIAEAVVRRHRRVQRSLAHARLDRELARLSLRESELLLQAREKHPDSAFAGGDPLISITIPTYNRGKILTERTLPSIFAQTYQNFEVVIVGDQCIDDTPERMRRIEDPRVRFVNRPVRGKYPSDKRRMHMVAGCIPINDSLDLVQGDWIAYMDDDDVALPHHLETLLRHAQQGNYELVFARHRVEQPDGSWEESGGPNFPSGRPPYTGCAIPHRTVLYRAYLKFFRYRVDAWKYEIGTDTLVWCHMGRAGVRWGYLPKVVALKHERAVYSYLPEVGTASS
jgi:glycosyltransferase involved in cell wall biosynthesis